MKRLYESVMAHHIAHYEQMAFLSGPRQIGKTTIAKHCHALSNYFKYLNWDKATDREQILSGVETIVKSFSIDVLAKDKPILVFDEIHKYKNWRTFLKGYIDEYKGDIHTLVTGSAKLNLYRRNADSLMGRYFLYRIHPFTINEMIRTNLHEELFLPPKKIDDDHFEALYEFGGFPEPLIKQDKSFYRRWQNLKQEQMIREDIRDLSQIQELAQLEVLSIILQRQVGQLLDYSSLAKKIRVSDQTIRRWINILESFFYCFTIKPWSRNISRSLLKQPKLYLWDWSVLQDKGAKNENFIASHLLKAVHFWTDMGLGKYDLYFLRDKDKHEVDFLVTRENAPWIMVEVKSSAKESINENLYHFQSHIQVPYSFQLAFDLPYIDKNCFLSKKILIVPVKTFLSQLV